MKKTVKFIVITLAVILITGLFFVFGDRTSVKQPDDKPLPTAADEQLPKYKIGIIKFDDSATYNQACNGFLNRLRDTGLTDGENVVIKAESADGSVENCVSISKTFSENNFDLIYAIGEESAVSAYEVTKEIPIVFSAVSDPEAQGLVESNETPNTNVTGVSNYTPCFEQMDLVLELFPNVKTVGALYCESDPDSLLQVNIAKKEAEKIGITLKTYSFKDADGIEDAALKMADEAEVFYLPTDRLVKNSLDEVVYIANDNNIPIIAGDEDMVQNGCLATYDIDYNSLGRSSADMAISILYNDADVKTMPVLYVSKCNLFINEEAAKLLEVNFSDEVAQKMIKL